VEQSVENWIYQDLSAIRVLISMWQISSLYSLTHDKIWHILFMMRYLTKIMNNWISRVIINHRRSDSLYWGLNRWFKELILINRINFNIIISRYKYRIKIAHRPRRKTKVIFKRKLASLNGSRIKESVISILKWLQMISSRIARASFSLISNEYN